jgi:hypothetical protein
VAKDPHQSPFSGADSFTRSAPVAYEWSQTDERKRRVAVASARARKQKAAAKRLEEAMLKR